MENPGYIALSRQMALSREMEVTAHNLANASTPGFKRSRLMFKEYLTRSERLEKHFDEKLAFVQDHAQQRVTEDGQLLKTDNDLDFAVTGEGYFVVDTPLGERYTRNGRFTIGADGDIVTLQGLKVKDTNGQPIPVPANAEKIEIVENGTILVTQTAPLGALVQRVQIGQFQIVNFDNDQRLREAGSGLLRPDVGIEPVQAENPRVLQGFSENSNVNAITELTRMINTSRSFGSAHKLLEAEHERMNRAYRALTKE